jgi:hypothetical protein
LHLPWPQEFLVYTPGGGIEPGETAEQAALREMEEEVGLTGLPLLGEVARRTAINDLFTRAALCHERYFPRSHGVLGGLQHRAAGRNRPGRGARCALVAARPDDLAASAEVLIPAAILPLARGIIRHGVPQTPVDLTPLVD